MALRLHFATVAVGLVAATVTSGTASARDREPQGTPALQALLECRTRADDTERLRCFDAAAGTMATAVQSRSVVVIDRAQLEQARRDEFGARRPPRGLPIPKEAGGGTLSQVDGVIARATQGGDGWTIALADGSVWRQADDTPLGTPLRAGEKVTVSRAALGTFKLKAGRRPAIRVRRAA